MGESFESLSSAVSSHIIGQMPHRITKDVLGSVYNQHSTAGQWAITDEGDRESEVWWLGGTNGAEA